MAAFTYTKPTVGGSEDTWGDTLNANWDALGTFIGPLDSTELAVLDGITASTAELNLLDGVTVALADITATATELNYVDGVTSNIQTQIDNIPEPPELTQVQVEDDTSTVFGQVSGERLAQAVGANSPTGAGGVGTYALCGINLQVDDKYHFGDTVSGSILIPGGTVVVGSTVPSANGTVSSDNAIYRYGSTASLSGTWRCMGFSYNVDVGLSQVRSALTLWLRIS